MAIEEAKFRTPVEPGCLLDLHVAFTQKRARVCKFAGKAHAGRRDRHRSQLYGNDSG